MKVLSGTGHAIVLFLYILEPVIIVGYRSSSSDTQEALGQSTHYQSRQAL